MAKDSKLDQLARVRLFSACSKKELTTIGRASDEVTVSDGAVLCEEGKPGHEFYLVLSGKVNVKKGGRKVNTLGPGDHFGELALLHRGPRNATVVGRRPRHPVSARPARVLGRARQHPRPCAQAADYDGEPARGSRQQEHDALTTSGPRVGYWGKRGLGMKKRLCALAVLAACAGAGGGLTNAAHAGGIKCYGADRADYIVCVANNDGDQITKVRVGTEEARVSHMQWSFEPEYTFSRTEFDAVVDASGVTVTEDHYDSDFYFEAQSWNTKHVGADGYHEHEDTSYYGPGSFESSSYDRSIDLDGYEETRSYDGECGSHTAIKTDLTIETSCP